MIQFTSTKPRIRREQIANFLQDDIIKIAKQAGFKTSGVVIRVIHSSGAWVSINSELQSFAHMIRAAALEEAAAECTRVEEYYGSLDATQCARAIRSMK